MISVIMTMNIIIITTIKITIKAMMIIIIIIIRGATGFARTEPAN